MLHAVARVPYSNPWGVATALRETADKHGPHLSLIPFNKFEPASTTWWLCPESDNPAYRWGKIAITQLGIEPDILVGIYVEKGIGPTAASAYSSPRDKSMIMQPDWLWPDFIKAFADGSIAKTVEQSARTAGTAAILAIDAQAVSPDASWNEERYSLPRDFVCFTIEGDAVSPAVVDMGANIAPSLSSITSLSSVPSALAQIPSPDWIWLDIQIGYVVTTDAQSSLPLWGSEELWQIACAPRKDWLRLKR